MAVEKGRVNEVLEACITLCFASGALLECVIDTGFSGALMLPEKLVSQLNARQVGTEWFTLVGGREIEAAIFVVEIYWFDALRTINAVISETDDALIGTELLKGTVLTVDYLSSQVEIKNDQEN
jgi:clan AA aspartic protease